MGQLSVQVVASRGRCRLLVRVVRAGPWHDDGGRGRRCWCLFGWHVLKRMRGSSRAHDLWHCGPRLQGLEKGRITSRATASVDGTGFGCQCGRGSVGYWASLRRQKWSCTSRLHRGGDRRVAGWKHPFFNSLVCGACLQNARGKSREQSRGASSTGSTVGSSVVIARPIV